MDLTAYPGYNNQLRHSPLSAASMENILPQVEYNDQSEDSAFRSPKDQTSTLNPETTTNLQKQRPVLGIDSRFFGSWLNLIATFADTLVLLAHFNGKKSGNQGYSENRMREKTTFGKKDAWEASIFVLMREVLGEHANQVVVALAYILYGSSMCSNLTVI